MSRDPRENAQREIERLWHDLVYHRHPSAHFTEHAWAPPTDVVATEDRVRVIVELAGVAREEVRVSLHGRVLEIRGRRTAPEELRGARYQRAEIYFGEFQRAIELPWEAEHAQIEATFRNGLLQILIPAPARTPTDVPIRERAL